MDLHADGCSIIFLISMELLVVYYRASASTNSSDMGSGDVEPENIGKDDNAGSEKNAEMGDAGSAQGNCEESGRPEALGLRTNGRKIHWNSEVTIITVHIR